MKKDMIIDEDYYTKALKSWVFQQKYYKLVLNSEKMLRMAWWSMSQEKASKK